MRHGHGEPREFSGAGGNGNLAAHLIGQIGDEIHADSASRILGRRIEGGKSGMEQQREYLLGIQGLRLFCRNKTFLERGFRTVALLV